jgi:putative hemin transport protein
MPHTVTLDAKPLLARWQTLLAIDPRLRIRDAAERLGVSERDLLLVDRSAEIRRILPPTGGWPALVARLEELDDVMALTRNDHCVHERHGRYENPSVTGHVGLVLGDEIDLRIFYDHWNTGFAVTQNGRLSLQIFDQFGGAIHKVYLTSASNFLAYEHLVDALGVDDSPPECEIATIGPEATQADSEIDVMGLHAAWDGLTDTHEFFPLLRRFGVGRHQALRLAGGKRARRVHADTVRAVLEAARDGGTPIMVFVGSPGVIQIHTGPIQSVVETGPWLNVMDPRFNLHLRATAVESAFVVRKPTSDGPVTSLELFDAKERTIAMLFGRRKPGQPEDPAWSQLLDQHAVTL